MIIRLKYMAVTGRYLHGRDDMKRHTAHPADDKGLIIIRDQRGEDSAIERREPWSGEDSSIEGEEREQRGMEGGRRRTSGT